MVPININNGNLCLDNGLVLSSQQQIVDLEAKGLHFVRVVSMGTGWQMYTTASDVPLAGDSVYLSFDVYEGKTTSVSFGYAEDRSKHPQVKMAHYSTLLRGWLGSPTSIRADGNVILYSYAWGDITAMYDTRGGSCSVMVRWAEADNQATDRTKTLARLVR